MGRAEEGNYKSSKNTFVFGLGQLILKLMLATLMFFSMGMV